MTAKRVWYDGRSYYCYTDGNGMDVIIPIWYRRFAVWYPLAAFINGILLGWWFL